MRQAQLLSALENAGKTAYFGGGSRPIDSTCTRSAMS
jgi:hypothetical protein